MARATVLLCTLAVARALNFGDDFAPTTAANMNGEYPFSPTPGGTLGKMPKNFRDYPGGVESFDFYAGPVTRLVTASSSIMSPLPLRPSFPFGSVSAKARLSRMIFILAHAKPPITTRI